MNPRAFRCEGSPRRRPARQIRDQERGLTLIEMLVAIAVISIGVVGIAYGFSAVVRGAGSAQQQAELDGAARYIADYLQSDSNVPYSICATSYAAPSPVPLAYRTAYPGVAWPSTSPVRESTASPNPGYSSLGAQCSDYGVQEITITVTNGARSLTRAVWKGP